MIMLTVGSLNGKPRSVVIETVFVRWLIRVFRRIIALNVRYEVFDVSGLRHEGWDEFRY